MALTLKSYTKQLTEELIKSAGKSSVRECDETEKGVFVSYVDESGNTFDVSLTILTKGEIGNSSCDCGDRLAFCRHRVALLMYIGNGAKTTMPDVKPAKANKKESPAAILLDDIAFGDLKEWLRGLMQKNKEIELAFISHFSAGRQYYSPDDVIKLVNEAAKAAGCTKKNVDTSQVKKLVELWGDVLKPVIQYYRANTMDAKAFLSFYTLIEQCRMVRAGINANTNRIGKYIEEVLKQSETAVNQLQAEAGWLAATGYFVQVIPQDKLSNIRVHFLLHLQNIIGASDAERREKLIGALMNQFETRISRNDYNADGCTKILFQIIVANDLFTRYYQLFTPLRFENEYNLELIHMLIKHGHLDLAKRFCREQIAGNYRAEYNIPYLAILKDIYASENDEENIAFVATELFPFTFDFDAYLFISGRMNPEEKKKWRTGVLNRARHAIHAYNPRALTFVFDLMDHEKNYKKMLGYIDEYTPYAIIYKYFELMLAADKIALLNAITNKRDSSWHYYSKEDVDNDSCFPDMFALMVKHYTADYLKLLVKPQKKPLTLYYDRTNRFMTYVKEQLEH